MHAKEIVALPIMAMILASPIAGMQDKDAVPEKVEKVGRDVTYPRLKYHTEPEYPPEAQAAHYEATCILKIVVGIDGTPRNIRVINPAGMGMDEKAVEAVRQWKFEPGRKEGVPVAVEIMVEVNFHLHDSNVEELKKKAIAGDAEAQFAYAEHLAKGQSPDYSKAYMWYTLAQHGGYKKSDNALRELTAKMTADQIKSGQYLVDHWNLPSPK